MMNKNEKEQDMVRWFMLYLTLVSNNLNKMSKIKIVLLVFMFIIAHGSCKNEEIDDPEIKVEREKHHPFLIVKKDQFQSLQSKSLQEPWKSMKDDALQRSNSTVETGAYDLQYYIGAAALSYILDKENADTHAMKVKNAIINQYSKLELNDEGAWGSVVPPMGSFFMAILSLDIVYDALSLNDIAVCEKVIEDQIFKIKREGSWVDIRRGTHGAWDIYKGIRTEPDDAYFEGIMMQITEDGVSPVTNHYAWERVGGGNSRISKSGYMDVLEFTGIDKRYYSNERLKKFHRWLFGSSVNCAKEMAIFGDMLPTQGINNDMLHRRVGNFDAEAAGYAAWFHKDRPAIGNILTYILPKSSLPEPVIPSSQIYKNGGAFFREKEDVPEGLHGVLYNIKSQDEWHTHHEVNGLSLSGLGNRLLVNGGRLGEPTRAAFLNNTLTINGENHSERVGGGIVEGFMANDFDYASGFSGPALTNAKHYRNLILVHGTVGENPYFVIFDEVEANPGDLIKNYLHPANESGISTIQDGMHYNALIDHYPTVNGGSLSIFYATTPLFVHIEKVQSAVQDRYAGYPQHSRLGSVYPVKPNGKLNLVTLLFPFNTNTSFPIIRRIANGEVTGSLISHGGNVKDIILESSNDQVCEYEDISFIGKAMIARKINMDNNFYFVRQGKKFMQGGVGFESDAPISIYNKGREGIIVSSGTRVKLNGPDIQSIRFDKPVVILKSEKNSIEVEIPGGLINFQ